MRRSVLTVLAALALTMGTAVAAMADDDGNDDPKVAHSGSSDHADPAAKTLPSHASATATANAFGQQGQRERAAHAAAKAAALHAANDAAGRDDESGRGVAHAKAHGQGPAAQAARGQATAGAARATHAPAPR